MSFFYILLSFLGMDRLILDNLKAKIDTRQRAEVEMVRQDVTVLHFSGALDPICGSSSSNYSEKKLWYFPILDFSETRSEVRGQ